MEVGWKGVREEKGVRKRGWEGGKEMIESEDEEIGQKEQRMK